jgi:hypothetical protein
MADDHAELRAKIATEVRTNWDLSEYKIGLAKIRDGFNRRETFNDAQREAGQVIMEETPSEGLEACAAANIRWMSDQAREELAKRAESENARRSEMPVRNQRRAAFDDRVRAEIRKREAHNG